jgi:hypothetical protein
MEDYNGCYLVKKLSLLFVPQIFINSGQILSLVHKQQLCERINNYAETNCRLCAVWPPKIVSLALIISLANLIADFMH